MTVWTKLMKAYRRWAEQRQAIEELSAMSDRELHDIAVSRDSISRIVRTGARA